MPRHEHEVRVEPAGSVEVRLRCRCAWKSIPLETPTVSRLAEIAQDHRRAASKDA